MPPSPTTPCACQRALRIVTLNVLAPELLCFFWRGSYGLPLLKEAAAYEHVTLLRFTNIARLVASLKPDVLLLQEVSDRRHCELGHFTTQGYLAKELALSAAGSSFKGRAMEWRFPPEEQPGPKRAGGPPRLHCDSGVATLYNAERVLYKGQVSKAEAHGESQLFPACYGSPFTLDAFELKPCSLCSGGGGGESGGGRDGGRGGGGIRLAITPLPFHVLNVHLKMEYPHIMRPLVEVFGRAAAALGRKPGPHQWDHVIFAGDLNASAMPSDLQGFLTLQPSLVDLGGSVVVELGPSLLRSSHGSAGSFEGGGRATGSSTSTCSSSPSAPAEGRDDRASARLLCVRVFFKSLRSI
jgi:hypothetical protein